MRVPKHEPLPSQAAPPGVHHVFAVSLAHVGRTLNRRSKPEIDSNVTMSWAFSSNIEKIGNQVRSNVAVDPS